MVKAFPSSQAWVTSHIKLCFILCLLPRLSFSQNTALVGSIFCPVANFPPKNREKLYYSLLLLAMWMSSNSADPNLFQSTKPIPFGFLIELVVHKDPLDCTRVRDVSNTSWGVNLNQPTPPQVVQEFSYSSTLSWGSLHLGLKCHSWFCTGSALCAMREVLLSPVLSNSPTPSTGWLLLAKSRWRLPPTESPELPPGTRNSAFEVSKQAGRHTEPHFQPFGNQLLYCNQMWDTHVS